MAGEILRHSFKALGTDIEIMLTAENQEDSKNLFSEIESLYREFEKKLSRFDVNSELTAINSSLGIPQKASKDFLAICKRSLFYYRETSGLFDPRIIEELEARGYAVDFYSSLFPLESKRKISCSKDDLTHDLIVPDSETVVFKRRMDFGGVAKGYFTDKIATLLRSKGNVDFIVDSGGNMYIGGKEKDKNGWSIGVEGIDDGKIILELQDTAIATSGISRRKWQLDGKTYHHLINPQKPGIFSQDIKTVTVVAETAECADVWAKTLFLLGLKEGMRLAEQRKIACLFLLYKGAIAHSSHLKRWLA